VSTRVGQALLAIPNLRARVDESDDYLRDVIRRVEDVLGELRPVPFDLAYLARGDSREIRLRPSRGTRWHVSWRGDAPDAVPLLSAPREARVEAFTPVAWPQFDEPLAPLEALVISVADELSRIAMDRGPSVEIARRLQSTIGAWTALRSEGGKS
jgi:hypothetical protein